MMDSKSIAVRIDRMGNVKVEAIGFMGIGCEAATTPIERALSGGEGVERTMKPEWSQTDSETEQDNHMTL